MPRVKRPSTTTTYAILGQLVWGEATTYELVKAMRRNLRYTWPRAESRIYEEARRLVDAGLASSREERAGARRRTMYAINEHGRQALRSWLASEPEAIVLEHGPLLRILIGREARPEDLIRAVKTARDHAEQMLSVGAPIADEFLQRRHPYQQEVHLRALYFDYLYRWALFNVDWADRTEAELRRWTDTKPSATKHRRALQRIHQAITPQANRDAA